MPLMIGLCGRILYPELLEGDVQMILPEMVLRHGNLLLQILFFGALLSAILSTTSGAILAPSTVMGENLIKPFLKNPSDRTMLRIMRWSVIFVTICSLAMALPEDASIFDLVSDSSALSLVALFIPLTAGLFWKKASAAGAIASMIAGMVVWIFCEYIRPTDLPSLVPGLGASILGMVLGSWLKPDDTYPRFLELRAKTQAA
jgi:solute:Na+ symporter, SSS family